MNNKKEPSFFIKSTENAFTNRQKNIFDQLNLVDKEKKQNSEHDEPDKSPPKSPPAPVNKYEGRQSVHYRKETKHFRGKESIFKRPMSMPPRFKSHDVPDYQKNPGKWTKYTLGDVSQDDMSERSNTAAAMSFLKELADRKNTMSEEDDKDLGDKIVFKPKKKADLSCTSNEGLGATCEKEKSSFASSKLVMPEYIVGREKKKEMKRSSKMINTEGKRSKEIKLSHLDEEDE